MTAKELISHFNRVFGLHNPWPKEFYVSPETYANCCQYMFEWSVENALISEGKDDSKRIIVCLGPNKRLMLKGVELLIKEKP